VKKDISICDRGGVADVRLKFCEIFEQSQLKQKMSRPHGGIITHVSKPSVTASATFLTSRKALTSMLDNLSFISVVSVQVNASSFIGEGVEIHFRHDKEKPKSVFFDKFGRNKSSLIVGPIHLCQPPLGHDHPSMIPTVGEILVGSLVPNTRKSHLQFVLRGWSSDAKPLKELLRVLKFGTKSTEFEMRSSLIQPSALLMMAPDSIKKSRDDIYMTARIILWASIRPLQVLAAEEEPAKFALKKEASKDEIDQAKSIKITMKASEFIDSLVFKLADQDLSDAFTEGLEIKKVEYDPSAYVPGQFSQFYSAPAPYPEYKPQSPQYAPASPEYAPASPYAPTSPVNPPSPPYRPSAKTPEYGDI
jgi:hypothetical protein